MIEGTGKGRQERRRANLSTLPSFPLLLIRSFSFSVHGLDRYPTSRPHPSRTGEVGMIYARHAEASVTVCLMHWSSLDPLLLSAIQPPVTSRHSSSCRSLAGLFTHEPTLFVVIDRSESSGVLVKTTHVQVSRARDEKQRDEE